MVNKKNAEDTLDVDALTEEAWWHFLVHWPSQLYYNEWVYSAVGPDFVKEPFEKAVREALSTVVGSVENDR